MEQILVVDDAPETLEVVQRNLVSRGWRVRVVSGVAEAMAALDQGPVDLVITDLKMPKASGLDLVRHVRENLADTEVMMITGFPSIEGAVEAVKTGADEYLPKPFTEDELVAAVRRSLDKLRMRRAGLAPADRLPWRHAGLIGDSAQVRRLNHAIGKAALTSATCLVTGESGTGKELVARAIHYGSARAAAPFVPVNCGGIPDGLIESELFGHRKGAFTGAAESRAGFFQTADGGTIFLDEIGDLPIAMQVKLLRVLEDKQVFMVGSSRPMQLDVRILAATNKDLGALVKREAFREDLFFRLAVLTIDVPALRDRGDDVLRLTRHFAEKFAGELGKPVPRFSDGALRSIAGYHWPGNVRELENVVQRLVVMGDHDVIDVPELPPAMRSSLPRSTGDHRTLAEVEAEHIRNVLSSVDGNVTRAAGILGIDRKTLRLKLGTSKPRE